MVRPGLLLLRADAGSSMGTGHFMRCLALAQQWRDRGGEFALFTHCRIPALLKLVRREAASIIHPRSRAGSQAEADELAKRAAASNAAWVVLDGYQFSADYQQRVKQSVRRLLAIDDHGHAGRYAADLVLDQNLTACEENYSQRAETTQLLLGTKYALLRREFVRGAPRPPAARKRAKRLIITMGGSDPENATARILRALIHCGEQFQARVVVGAGNQHLKMLRGLAAKSATPIKLETKVSNMSALMAWAHLAISAAGTTLYELAFMGVPAMTVELVDHQIPLARGFARAGASVNLGWHNDLDESRVRAQLQRVSSSPKLMRSMSNGGRKLVDGRGAERVVRAMLDYDEPANTE